VAIVVVAAWRSSCRALQNNVLSVLAAASFLAIFAFQVPCRCRALAVGIIG
jgi:hypothetical protein